MTKYFIGFDPGKTSGGMCILDSGGASHVLLPMPSIQAIIAVIKDIQTRVSPEIFVGIEKSQPMPKQGVSSVFNYGEHFGMLQGMVVALGLPYELITPQTWGKVMHAGIAKKLSSKERSLEAARRLFPNVNLLATPKCKKPHSGMFEALLIAEYVRRKYS